MPSPDDCDGCTGVACILVDLGQLLDIDGTKATDSINNLWGDHDKNGDGTLDIFEFDALIRLIRRNHAKRSLSQASYAVNAVAKWQPPPLSPPPPPSPMIQPDPPPQQASSPLDELAALQAVSGLHVRDQAKLQDQGLSMGMSAGEAHAQGISQVEVWTDSGGNISRRGF